MSYKNYDEFCNKMDDILSSGSVFEMTSWHTNQIKLLLKDMDRNQLIDDLNNYYSDQQEPDQLREGELDLISELVNCSVSFKIEFK